MSTWSVSNLPRIRDDLVHSLGRPEVARWIQEQADVRHQDPATGGLNYPKDVRAADLIRWSHGAELYFVTNPMTQVVNQAAAAMPPYRLHPDDLPSPQGLLVWDGQPVPPPRDSSAPIVGGSDESGGLADPHIRAVLWGHTESRLGPGILVTTLVDTDTLLDDPDYQARWRPDDYRRSPHLRRDFGPLIFGDQHLLRYADLPDTLVRNRRVASILTTWLLMGQRITITTREPVSRQIRKQYTRDGRPEPLVRSVTLRRASNPTRSDPDGQGSLRQYHHQWIVGGHWRNQWYPSRGEHRPFYIAQFVKGPEGAPFIGGERVNVLRR